MRVRHHPTLSKKAVRSIPPVHKPNTMLINKIEQSGDMLIAILADGTEAFLLGLNEQHDVPTPLWDREFTPFITKKGARCVVFETRTLIASRPV